VERVPPKILPRGKFPAPLAVICFVVGALALATTVFIFDPARHSFFPGCTFHKITGLNCPGCGATRSLHALLHGEFSTALRDNALFIAALFFFGLRGGWWAVNFFRGRTNGSFFQPQLLWPALVLAGLFSVLRNFPAFSFLSP
jgi:hypothetical protein